MSDNSNPTDRMKQKYRARVLECRLSAHIPKQKDLARLTGIAPTIISELESGALFLSSPYALAIAEACKCSLDNLFEVRTRR